ncbi:MAG: DUF4388 domain-containing protein [Candidatus Sericytochromatia bacterium]|nr:DUF4388 domain-containing protein [Candidatus Sericytochromatia bacterium]
MSKIILSGDLGRFRPEMLVRILESIRADVIVTLESASTGQITVLQGKVVGAAQPPNKGMEALKEMVGWNTGTFTVRDISGTQTSSMVRSPDIMNFPDNASIFRAMMSLRGGGGRPPGAPPQAPSAPPRPMPQAGPGPGGPPQGAPAPRPMAAPAPSTRTTIAGPKIGPLAKIPHLTDKGRTTVKSLQANFARGVNVEGDKWRVLMKCNGESNLYQIGEEVSILGDRLMKATKELQTEALISFDSIDDQSAQRLTGNFKFGEYMIAKGHITQVQLEAALQRQQELARKGRYMWLGEILVEMNYVRPSQVQEALAYQKRVKK